MEMIVAGWDSGWADLSGTLSVVVTVTGMASARDKDVNSRTKGNNEVFGLTVENWGWHAPLQIIGNHVCNKTPPTFAYGLWGIQRERGVTDL